MFLNSLQYQCHCKRVNLYSALTANSLIFWMHHCATTVRTKMSLAGAWKQLRLSSDFGQGPEDCSRRTHQQWQKPGAAVRVESAT